MHLRIRWQCEQRNWDVTPGRVVWVSPMLWDDCRAQDTGGLEGGCMAQSGWRRLARTPSQKPHLRGAAKDKEKLAGEGRAGRC